MLFLTSILLFPLLSFSQSSTGALQGEVQDATHGRIPKASVTVRSLGTSLERQVSTTDRGEFRYRRPACPGIIT